MNLKTLFTIMLALFMLAPLAVVSGETSPSALERCTEAADATEDARVENGACGFLSIQTAVDYALSYEAILVQASTVGAPLAESIHIKTDYNGADFVGLTICAVANVDAPEGYPVALGAADDCAEDQSVVVDPVIDASGVAVNGRPAVFDVEAPNVVITGFTMRWTLQYDEEVLGTDSNDPLLPSGPTGNPAEFIQQTQMGLFGVRLNAENIHVIENNLQMRSGPCATGVSPCNSPVPGVGVFISNGAPGAQILNNQITGSTKIDEGTVAGDVGIMATGAGYLIEGNTFQYWTGAGVRVTPNAFVPGGLIFDNTFDTNVLYGVHVQSLDAAAAPTIDNNTFRHNGAAAILLQDSDAVTITDNAIQPGLVAPMTGIWVRGADDVRVAGNTFSPLNLDAETAVPQPGFAVTVGAGSTGDAPQNLVLRENEFGLTDALSNQYAVTVSPDVQTTTIDARLNDWGVYSWGQVNSRVLDAGVTNTVLVLPYIEG